MNSFLRNLTTSQQIGALFIVVFGVLSLATLWGFFRSLREHASDDPQAEAHAQEVKRFWGLIKTSWVMATVFWIGWALGDTVATVLFAIVGFFALREFITLSPTRRGDHRSLVLAFFVVLPLQFTIVGSRMFDLFTVFIPVYVFLALPVVSALANDPERFLERNAKLQWGIMVCVYGMSHVPALLLLDWVGLDIKGPLQAYDGITGVPGSGKRAWESLQLVVQSGVPYECRTTWNPALFDLDALQDLGETLVDSGVTHWALQQCRAPGLAASEGLPPVVETLGERFASFSVRRG